MVAIPIAVSHLYEVHALNIDLACICLCLYVSTHIKVCACDIYSFISLCLVRKTLDVVNKILLIQVKHVV